jgi:hypothetical protein
MGTRSLTIFQDHKRVKNEETGKYEENGVEDIVVLYRQFDGYFEGMGKDIAEFLSEGKLVNGFSFGTKEKQFNGMGDLAQRLVASFGTEVGNFYLEKADTRDCGEEFRYYIYPTKDGIRVKVEEGAMTAFGCAGPEEAWEETFDGTIEEFCNMIHKKVKEES